MARNSEWRLTRIGRRGLHRKTHRVELNHGVGQPGWVSAPARAPVNNGHRSVQESIFTAVSNCPIASNPLPGICKRAFPKAARRRAFRIQTTPRFQVRRRFRIDGRESARERLQVAACVRVIRIETHSGLVFRDRFVVRPDWRRIAPDCYVPRHSSDKSARLFDTQRSRPAFGPELRAEHFRDSGEPARRRGSPWQRWSKARLRHANRSYGRKFARLGRGIKCRRPHKALALQDLTGGL